MKLLIITQVVDIKDDNLSFFHEWLSMFSNFCEEITVICLYKGDYRLPENVKVVSLGKESGKSKLKYLYRFYRNILKEKNNYDRVFVHMNTEYVILGGLLWRMWKKRISLWYTHKNVDWKLRIAEKLVHIIFTASEKSFRLPSKKLYVMGHGINTEIFKPAEKNTRGKILLSVGRFSATKQILEMIKIYQNLIKKIPELKFIIVGGPIYKEDKKYFNKVNGYLRDNLLEDKVVLKGSMPHLNVLQYYQQADLFINLSKTGSLDKAVLEAMACNIPVVTTNEAFENIVPSECFVSDISKVESTALLLLNDFNKNSRAEIINNHSLDSLIKKIIDSINKI